MYPKVTIHITSPDDPPRVLSFTQPEIYIGRVANHRDVDNDVVLSAPRISKRHAHILVIDEGLTLVDHSVNGTFVNGQAIDERRQLNAGDRIELDAFTLLCEVERPPPATPTPQSHWSLAPEDPDVPNFLVHANPSRSEDAHDLPDGDEPITSLVSKPPSQRATSGSQPPLPRPPPSRTDALQHHVAAERAQGLEHDSPWAQLYRDLAVQYQAPAWGRPPALDASTLGQVLASARELCERRALRPSSWPDRIARELCELGPLGPLLDDPAVTRLLVRGYAEIDVFRGDVVEPASVAFSCSEAFHAVIERLSGSRLGALPIDAFREDGLRILSWSARLSPSGPLVILERGDSSPRTIDDLIVERVLDEDAAAFLRRALDAGLNLIVHGDQSTEPRPLLVALSSALSEATRRVVIRRSAAWPSTGAIILDGHDPEAWPCARRLSSEWLVVENLEPSDLPHLTALARHHGGGVLASIHARSHEAALRRMGVYLASRDDDLAGAERLVYDSVDLLVGVHDTPSGLRVRSIAEVRSPGEFAELFAWTDEYGELARTSVTSGVLP